MKIEELIARWNTDEGKPYKGSLIDMSSYEDGNLSCMCAQGQVLHVVGGWDAQMLEGIDQGNADKETAALLNISRAHAVLLRLVNDSVDGAPAIVLTDPAKVLGDQWSKLLDFWWHIDTLDAEGWQKVVATWDAAGVAAGVAAWVAAGVAARGATWDAAWEIQGSNILKEQGKEFFFLPMFGFASPDDIPPRPANYGTALQETEQ